jgi:hypothetical protein
LFTVRVPQRDTAYIQAYISLSRAALPHFEKATRIKTDYPVATSIVDQNGVNYAGKKAVTRQVRSRYRKAGRKEKSAIPDEFISITGYKNRK